jgi:hypothetical protein
VCTTVPGQTCILAWQDEEINLKIKDSIFSKFQLGVLGGEFLHVAEHRD